MFKWFKKLFGKKKVQSLPCCSQKPRPQYKPVINKDCKCDCKEKEGDN